MTNEERTGDVCLGVDEDGEPYIFWEQPSIDIEWSTTCGEWQADTAEETFFQRVLRVGAKINEWKAEGKLQD